MRALPVTDDPTVYPVEERVGEDLVQRWIIELLRPLVARWLRERGVEALVGADQFIYFEQGEPGVRVSPDLYVLPGVPASTPFRSWKTWESGIVPSLVLEVVSLEWEKDYVDMPRLHGQLGTQELILFDPEFAKRRQGARFQRFERAGQALRLSERTNADRICSPVLGCFVRTVGTEWGPSLRLALLPDGEDLYPTAEEAERLAKEAERAAKEAERAAKEAERAAKEAERAAKEAERAAKEAALARVAELEALLKHGPR